MSAKHIIEPSLERRWDYHEADCDRVSRRIERFCSGDVQIIANYLHANENPTIEDLAEYAKRCWAEVGGRPKFKGVIEDES